MSTDTTPATATSTATASSEATEPAIETVRRQLEHAAGHLDIDPNVIERLKHPATVGDVITEANAGDVEAGIVVEGANGPTTFAADRVLEARGVPVIPDILANAGGVTVSYFEWLQDINRRSWSLEEVDTELDSEMRSAWAAVEREVERRDVSWRDAPHVVALSRIAEAHELRGLWPRGARRAAPSVRSIAAGRALAQSARSSFTS